MLDVSKGKAWREEGGYSLENWANSDCVVKHIVDMLRYKEADGSSPVKASDIGVVVIYKAQAARIKINLRQALGKKEATQIYIADVDEHL